MGREDHLTYTCNLAAVHRALAAGETVTLKTVAEQCKTSRSGAMRYINALRKLGAPIEWQDETGSYRYKSKWDLSRAQRKDEP